MMPYKDPVSFSGDKLGNYVSYELDRSGSDDCKRKKKIYKKGLIIKNLTNFDSAYRRNLIQLSKWYNFPS